MANSRPRRELAGKSKAPVARHIAQRTGRVNRNGSKVEWERMGAREGDPPTVEIAVLYPQGRRVNALATYEPFTPTPPWTPCRSGGRSPATTC
jgi:hypothetical protein